MSHSYLIYRKQTKKPMIVKFSRTVVQATLFDEENGQIITHFFSPNPAEGGTVRAAWQHAKDTSSVWGRA